MSEQWLLNASPVIILARAGYAELLVKIPDEVILPEAVVVEIEAGPIGDTAVSFWLPAPSR